MPKRLFLFTLVATLISGCAARGPTFTPITADPNQSVLIIYRPDSFAAGARAALITIDTDRTVQLRNNGYTMVRLAPGTHKLTQIWDPWFGDAGGFDKQLSIEVHCPANSSAYVKVETHSFSPGARTIGIGWKIQQVPPDQALREIATTRLSY